jgi:hypothetical protein
MRRSTAVFAFAVTASVAAYAAVVRPWMLSWGATTAEEIDPLPGDDLAPDARYVTWSSATTRRSGPTGGRSRSSSASRSTPTWRPD